MRSKLIFFVKLSSKNIALQMQFQKAVLSLHRM